MHRRLLLVTALLLVPALSGCGALGGLIQPTAHGGVAAIEPVFVASSRAQEADGRFGAGRSAQLSYTEYEVSIPPNHVAGNTPQQSSVKPDPARDFGLGAQRQFADAAGFDDAVVASSLEDYGAPAEVLVFVHGFNTSYIDSIYQLAQIGHDLDLPAAKVLYSWPSNDRLLDYVHDLDSAGFARDGLQDLLEHLASSGVRRIVIAGYSMGASLVVETLREMKLGGSNTFFSKLGGVVLMSPDMDIDLFRSAGERMGGLPQPFVIYSSPNENAFKVMSDYVTGGRPRLGALPDPNALAGLNLIFVDVGRVPQSKQKGHLPVATSPGMIAAINSLPRADLIEYAELAARGGVAGAAIRHFGGLTYVVLPATVQ